MTIPQLSRLQSVPLREAWPHEAGSFTPWLAQCENLQLLGEAVGMSLECEAQEHAVGDFSADIVCRDINTDRYVLVENQIERTDHGHLGQLITYAAGLKAATVIWIAANFREEHRAALDWLNEITTDDFNFIGIEIQLWRIGDSVPAPTFKIISKPNHWSREIRDNARESGDLSKSKILQREYWEAFVIFMQAAGGFRNIPTPQYGPYISFAFLPGTRLALVASNYNNKLESWAIGELRAEVLFSGVKGYELFNLISQRINDIEAAFAPDKVQWDDRDVVKNKKIYIVRDANVSERSEWSNQHQWLYQYLIKLDKVFRHFHALSTTQQS